MSYDRPWTLLQFDLPPLPPRRRPVIEPDHLKTLDIIRTQSVLESKRITVLVDTPRLFVRSYKEGYLQIFIHDDLREGVS